MIQTSVKGNPRNHDSLYLQVAAVLRRDITQMQHAPGDRLPSIAELAKKFDVAIVTVRTALALLEEEGLVRRFRGKGTFVASDAMAGKWLILDAKFQSLLDHLEGKKFKVLKASNGGIQPMIPPELGTLSPEYRYLRRVHLNGRTPYALINIYISLDIYERAPERFDNGMVIPVLATMQEVRQGSMHQSISFSTADPETAHHLDLPVNGPIGDVLRVIRDKERRILYVGQTKYRGEYVRVQMDIPSLEQG